MDSISFFNNGRNLVFSYRDIVRGGKTIDLQTLQEIFNENVYRVEPDHLSGEKIVVDAGANIGGFSIQAAALGAAKVYAIEPVNSNIVQLNANIQMNNFENVITPIERALWSSNKTVKIDDLDRDSRVESVANLESENSKEVTGHQANDSSLVKTITLEELIEQNNITEIDILKMDIEWSEYEVIPSWSDELMRKIKYLCLEWHGTDKQTLGNLLAHLTREFRIECLGSYERGGFIWARRY